MRANILKSLVLICMLIWQPVSKELISQPPSLLPAPHKQVALSYSLGQQGEIVVPARLNQRYLGTFVVDTGSLNCLISKEMVAQAGLSAKPIPGKVTGLGVGEHPEFVTIHQLQLGTLSLPNVGFIVVPSKFISFGKQHADGVLGINLLRSMALLLDSQKHDLTFYYPGNLSEADIKSAGMIDVSPLKIKPNAIQCYTVPVTLNDQTTEDLMIDTGLPLTLLSIHLARQLKLQPTEQVTIDTALRRFPANISRLVSIRVGSARITDPAVFYTDKDIATSNSLGQDLSPLRPSLGRDTLSKFRVLLDFPAQAVYLQPKQRMASNTVPLSTQGADASTYAWYFRYEPGQVYRSKSKMLITGTLPDGSPLHIEDTHITRYKVKQVDTKGEATLVLSDEPDPRTAGGQAIHRLTRTRTYSREGLLLRETVENVPAGAEHQLEIARLLTNMPIPDKPVHIGDTWQMELDSHLVGDKKVTLTSRLIGKEPMEGIDTLKIEVRMEIPEDMAEVNFIHVQGTYHVDPKQGRLVHADYTLKNVLVPSPGGAIIANMEIEQNLLLPSDTATKADSKK